ncbi:hypothetical protein [Antarctobacter heliothermus]|uniref:Uncharacterized protein n=1 Tax=Antarctobacter heliothermus TaxID=74033 RepID=A0A239M311_9RHOB|nr:hypothetical protein [Antarctobacter heliothermus]SNT37086.1 hypothetical protein SAMN04488078_11172 [Antarctobacter heliothermus]
MNSFSLSIFFVAMLCLPAYAQERVFFFDAAFEQQFDTEVPIYFTITVPEGDGVDTQAGFNTSTGAVAALLFREEDPATGGMVLLESIQVSGVRLPLTPDAEDPAAARTELGMRVLAELARPMVTENYAQSEVLVLEPMPHASVAGTVHMLVGLSDPEHYHDRLARVVLFPHPNQETSYLATTIINLGPVPITDQSSLLATITGRILDSFAYLPQ